MATAWFGFLIGIGFILAVVLWPLLLELGVMVLRVAAFLAFCLAISCLILALLWVFLYGGSLFDGATLWPKNHGLPLLYVLAAVCLVAVFCALVAHATKATSASTRKNGSTPPWLHLNRRRVSETMS